MPQPVSIPKEASSDPLENFDALKNEAIALLAEWCAPNWTDFNAHDPGVQILEAICYALTDLGHRTKLPITQIIQKDSASFSWEECNMPSPLEVFPMSALTANDYRKLILDNFDQVRDAWWDQPQSSPPKIWLSFFCGVPESNREGICKEVYMFLSRHRNLCEEFGEVLKSPEVPFTLEANFRLAPGYAPETALVDLWQAVQNSATPQIPTKTLKDYRTAGIPLSTTLTGPLPNYGIIPDDALVMSLKWEEVTEHVKAAILNIPNLELIGQITLEIPTKEDWATFVFCDKFSSNQAADAKAAYNRVRLFSGSTFLTPNEGDVARLLENKPKKAAERSSFLVRNSEWKSADPKADGTFGDFTSYHSIQSEFPPNYGLDIHQLPSNATSKRRAQAKQLKAFLLFFEQVMANHLAQLASVDKLLCGHPVDRTYFSAPLKTVPGIYDLMPSLKEREPKISRVKRPKNAEQPSYTFERYETALQRITEEPITFFRRREQFLDHILARYCESYPRFDPASHATFYNKTALLENIAETGKLRARALDLNAPPGQSCSGLELKLRALLPRNNQSWPQIEDTEPGQQYYYLLENRLFLPRPQDDLASWHFGLTHVLLNWTDNPLNEAFQNFVEQIILENTAAHCHSTFIWLEAPTHKNEAIHNRDPRWTIQAFNRLYTRWAASRSVSTGETETSARNLANWVAAAPKS